MAVIKTISMDMDEIFVIASVSEQENEMIKCSNKILIFPNKFDESLTTGKLGNSNRIMLPKKILKKHEIELRGKVPARLFECDGNKYLLVKLEERIDGVPYFED